MIFRIFLTIVFCAAAVTNAAAQAVPNAVPRATPEKVSSLKGMPAGSVYQAPDKSFSIAAPSGGEIKLSSADTEKGIAVAQYKWKLNEGALSVMRSTFSKQTFTTPEEIEALLAKSTRSLKSDPAVKIESETEILQGKYGGVEIVCRYTAGYRVIVRNFAYGNTAYSVIAAPNDLAAGAERLLTKALDSFTIADAGTIMMVQEAVTSELPQTPPASPVKRTTDAQDMFLKGKVRSVLLRHMDGAGETMWREESFFNERGDLVRVEFYDVKGSLTSVTHYGYTAGQRVSRKTFPGGGKEQKIPAAGYDTRYVYSYDDNGQLSRKVVTSAGGENIYDYAYAGTKIGWTYREKSRDFAERTMLAFDKDGQMISRTRHQTAPEPTWIPPSEESFAYSEIDAQGNWRKSVVTISAKLTNTTAATGYSESREITYY